MSLAFPLDTSASNTSMHPSGNLDGRVILVVEDDPDARDLMEAVLERHAATILKADSVGAAFELLAEHAVDLIVSDIAMPDEDGIMLITRLRGRAEGEGGKTPAIAVSAFVGHADRTRALGAGFDRYVHKPIDFDLLLRTILGLLPAA